MFDLAEEARNRETFSGEQQRECLELANDLLKKLEGRNLGIVMNVLLSALVHVYVNEADRGLPFLLERISANYRARSKSDGPVN